MTKNTILFKFFIANWFTSRFKAEYNETETYKTCPIHKKVPKIQ